MKLKLYGNLEGLEEGISILAEELSIEIAEDGFLVKVENRHGNVEVKSNKGQGSIAFDKKIHFFRALGLFVEAFRQQGEFGIIEEPQFESNGIMLDVSRNAVLKVDSIKRILRIMALMGLNLFMLYTEDTYEIKARPYFGYMRGRYSYNELKECDDFANVFGIEMVPCIQTLAHLSSALKWNYAKDIKDTDEILLAGCDKTYEFIEDMVKAASRPFRSKRIHVGMDEAHSLGLGKYLDLHGYRNRFEIMNEHLERVKDIVDKNNLKPMIWSDMYFRLASKTGDYYDPEVEIPDEVIRNIPEGIQLVYWDYYHHKQEAYEKMIGIHKTMGREVLFAGGIWVFQGISVNYDKTFVTTNASLSACKKEGVKEVIATMWGDDGAETSCFCGLIGFQLYAEHGYASEIDLEKLKRRFKFCTSGEFEEFMDLTFFDNVPGYAKEDENSLANPSKFILWQDVLTGLFDRNIEGMKLSSHYLELVDKMERASKKDNEWSFIFDMYARLAEVLVFKNTIGIEVTKAYGSKDIEALRDIAHLRLPELAGKIGELRHKHRELWFKTCKPFGWDVIDMRYGGLNARLDTAIFRILEYVIGDIKKIEELEEEKLFFNEPHNSSELTLCFCNLYRRIATACHN